MFSPRIKIIEKPYINCNRQYSLTIHLITLRGWLDTLDIVIKSNEKGSGSTVYFTLAGTGLCTVTNPCSLVGNVFCCWFPFASVIQNDRLQILKNICDKKLSIVSVENLCNL